MSSWLLHERNLPRRLCRRRAVIKDAHGDDQDGIMLRVWQQPPACGCNHLNGSDAHMVRLSSHSSAFGTETRLRWRCGLVSHRRRSHLRWRAYWRPAPHQTAPPTNTLAIQHRRRGGDLWGHCMGCVRGRIVEHLVCLKIQRFVPLWRRWAETDGCDGLAIGTHGCRAASRTAATGLLANAALSWRAISCGWAAITEGANAKTHLRGAPAPAGIDSCQAFTCC